MGRSTVLAPEIVQLFRNIGDWRYKQDIIWNMLQLAPHLKENNAHDLIARHCRTLDEDGGSWTSDAAKSPVEFRPDLYPVYLERWIPIAEHEHLYPVVLDGVYVYRTVTEALLPIEINFQVPMNQDGKNSVYSGRLDSLVAQGQEFWNNLKPNEIAKLQRLLAEGASVENLYELACRTKGYDPNGAAIKSYLYRFSEGFAQFCGIPLLRWWWDINVTTEKRELRFYSNFRTYIDPECTIPCSTSPEEASSSRFISFEPSRHNFRWPIKVINQGVELKGWTPWSMIAVQKAKGRE
jgi:hypothetical protein